MDGYKIILFVMILIKQAFHKCIMCEFEVLFLLKLNKAELKW